MLNLDNDHFCILPWIHLHVSQNGRVSPCCNNNRYLGNVQENSIENIWKGEKFEELREQFKNNISDKRCSHCYNIEASGKKSMRQISNQKYTQELNRVEENNPEPIYLDIRFSNICNFKCVTCWHGNSSAWFEEGGKKNASKNRIIKAFTNNFDELLHYLDDVKEIYFAGGEPLIMEEHYQIIEELEQRQLFDVELRYNTNFSNFKFKNKNVLHLWKKFKKVHISASVDAAFETGEQIREGFRWKEFIENRKQMLDICPEIYFEIAPTVSTLNIFNLPELHRELVTQQLLEIDHIYLNFLERPFQYNLKSLSFTEKEKAKKLIEKHLQWLIKNSAKENILIQYKTLLNFLY
ncbi:MAG: twitch domain-containing radical SAM protein [Flavobacteriales bacterium]|nr:twitch domain-containing radical SAM protein [Flavobacteriales bacterium]MCB9335988.1 twitch domain-containing radical SAM protein [Flavobacteriales bacterium]